uniref:Uncharacterized protein n=1 Tax=Rhizophagus irregularis (strain DAOM 181602 / DAOM 197198 / MUCL 43194) TaxID=747089 RepID=U9U8B2_RHIID
MSGLWQFWILTFRDLECRHNVPSEFRASGFPCFRRRYTANVPTAHCLTTQAKSLNTIIVILYDYALTVSGNVNFRLKD